MTSRTDMGAKTEIGWKARGEDGIRRDVYARQIGDRWCFFVREKRFEQWEKMERPLLEDWMELLDAVERRANRRLMEPDEPARLKKIIKEHFPEADV